MKKIFLSLLLIFSLSITACGIVNKSRSNSVTKEIGASTESSYTIKDNETSEISEIPHETIGVGNGSISIQVKDSECKLKLVEDVIMLLDVNNNATVYYQDTKVKTYEQANIYEGYLYNWACNSGNLVLSDLENTEKSEEGTEAEEDDFVDENITSINIDGKSISFLYRFSTDGNADVYLLEDLDLGTFLGIHIYGKGENLDDVVSLMKQYIL